MKQSEMILELAIQNKGIVTASMVKEKNLSAGVLKYLCDNGKLEKQLVVYICYLRRGMMNL
ncbi:MAG: type IV toxin-antitoxin system AbiEi family antitoxin domain-containing protein [Acetivibrio sp.]